MKTFNIIGCCICRDIFRINPCTDRYKVNKFIQSINPVSFVQEPQNKIILSEEDLGELNWPTFTKRNVLMDFNKTAEQYIIKGGKTDYIILDLCELRKDLLMLSGGGTVLTKDEHVMMYLSHAKDVFWSDIKISENDVYKALDKYMDFILSLYKPEQIILIENYPVTKLIDDKNNFFYEIRFGYIFLLKQRLNRYYDYVIKRVPKMNVIKMPCQSLGWTGHTWGIGSLHFVDEYYIYLFRALEIIVDGQHDKDLRLSELRRDYSRYFALLEKEKRLEYYVYKNSTESLLCNSALESREDNKPIAWKLSHSKKAKYDADKHELSTEDDNNSYVILSQEIPITNYLGKSLTLSVKYKTEGYSILSFGFTLKQNGNVTERVLRSVNSCSETVDSITWDIPLEMEKVDKVVITIYLNKQNSKAIIKEVKLELGDRSSLV